MNMRHKILIAAIFLFFMTAAPSWAAGYNITRIGVNSSSSSQVSPAQIDNGQVVWSKNGDNGLSQDLVV